jgi:hypothetical protein
VRAPVCTEKGEQFPNACEALCHQVEDFQLCANEKKNCSFCDRYSGPEVCRGDKRWDNFCLAVCDGEALALPQICSTPSPTEGGPSCRCVDTELDQIVCKGDRYWTSPCRATCAGVNDASTEQCRFPTDTCTCGTGGPVVCWKGERWRNRCYALREGMTEASQELCTPCRCSNLYSPVCLGKERWRNQCLANCDGARDARPCLTMVPSGLGGLLKQKQLLFLRMLRKRILEKLLR